MDTFENSEFPEAENERPVTPAAEPAAPVQPESGAYRGVGAGRKESPYADSPYVMNRGYQRESWQYQPQTQPPEKPKKEKKPRKPVGKRLVAALLVVALVAGGCLITAASVNEYWEERNEDTVEMLTAKIDALQSQIDAVDATVGVGGQLPAADGDAMTPAQLYAQNVNSVVAISSTVESYLYGQSVEGSSSGSGFILTEDGYVITNYHVVEGASAIDVITHNGTEYPAEVVGYDSGNDIAVLKVEAEGLSAAAIGSSSDVVTGDMVVAIGNPLGELTSTQTVGYVSGINREVSTDNSIINMIQTDAAINPGNSRGPLFNMYGQVIGITTAKYSGTTNSGASIEGIGFAIPIDDVMGMISDLIDYGYVTGAYLGVTVQNNNAEAAALYGLPTSGAYVLSGEKDAAADRAGIRAKDIIIDLGGYDVSTVTDLTRALRNFKAGDVTSVTVVRSGSELTLDITLDEKPHDTTAAEAPEDSTSVPSEGDFNEWYDYFRRYFGD